METSVAARRRAILCVLGEGLGFTIAAAMIKTTRPAGIPVFEMVVFRSIVITLIMTVALARKGELRAALHTRQRRGHAIRTGLGFFAMCTSYYGYLHLPLATVTALNFAMPLFLTVLSVPLLGERVGWRRWLAVLVGLGGVLMIIRPWRDATAQMPMDAVGMLLAGVFAWAVTMITVRKMGAAGERNETIVFYYSLGSLVLSLFLALPNWVAPSPRIALLLTLAGVVTAAAQWLMTEAYRVGETTLVAPFEYGAIVWATLFGVLLWGEWPDVWSVAGIVVLIAAGLFIWWRETTGRGAARPVVTVVKGPRSAPGR